MKWALRILVLVALVGGWIVAMRSIHVIRATDVGTGHDRYFILPKARWRLHQTVIDTRNWTPADLAANADIVRQIIASGRADVLSHVVPPSERPNAAAWLGGVLASPPASQPSTQPAG